MECCVYCRGRNRDIGTEREVIPDDNLTLIVFCDYLYIFPFWKRCCCCHSCELSTDNPMTAQAESVV